MANFLVPGKNGFSFEEGCEDSLYEALLKVIKGEHLRRLMGQQSRELLNHWRENNPATAGHQKALRFALGHKSRASGRCFLGDSWFISTKESSMLVFCAFLVMIFVLLPFGPCAAAEGKPIEILSDATITLGKQSDFDKVGKGILVNRDSWGWASIDGNIRYRKLKPATQTDLLFAAFDVDEKGFCKHDMVLEIYYRDDLRAESLVERVVETRAIIQSRLDFFKKSEYTEVGYLRAEGDGRWKPGRIFLEKSPRQQIRAIDGTFQFRIVMPSSGSRQLPVSYFRLFSINHREFTRLREQERAKRGLKRVEHKGRVTKDETKDVHEQDIAVFPVNYLELVFENDKIERAVSGKPLECFEVAGQAEPVSFVVNSTKDLPKVRVEVTELRSEAGTIESSNIEIRQVMHCDQRWGWASSKRYGRCPDHLGLQDPIVEIRAGENCQFWLTIDVPKRTSPGLYKGQVKIYSRERTLFNLPLFVEVLPIRLSDDKVRHMLYHSPFFKNFHTDPRAVLKDMRDHGLVPIFYPKKNLIKSRSGRLVARLDGFEYELELFRTVYPETKMIFVGISDYFHVWTRLGGPKPEFQYSFPDFDVTYARILKSYADLAKKFDLDVAFSFADEPGMGLQKRRYAYLCSYIAKNKGLETWSATYFGTDRQLRVSAEEKRRNVNYLRPMSEVLTIFMCPIREVNEKDFEKRMQQNIVMGYYTTHVCTSVRPTFNRFLNGIYPFVTGAEYVVNYAYRDSVADPFDDLDNLAYSKREAGVNDYLLTYPTWDGGILPTLSYEALREGVEDSRLISTLSALLDRVLDSGSTEAIEVAREANNFLRNTKTLVSKDFRRKYWKEHRNLPVDPMEQKILRDLNVGGSEDYEVFDRIRRGICDRIINLQKLVD